MENVVGIIDMDGYQINKKFYCKELGALKIGELSASSFFFDIGVHWGNLAKEDRATCRWARNLHKLPFGVPRGIKAIHIDNLDNIVINFYDSVRLGPFSTVAYKGGHFERDLLAKLNIPAVNLENFGCPKAASLFDDWTGWRHVNILGG